MNTIYNSYDLLSEYEEQARESLRELRDNDNPTDDELWDEIYALDEMMFDDAMYMLKSFFDGSTWVAHGTIGRWNGNVPFGYVFKDFKELLGRLTKDCDYIHIYDDKGHLFVECTHHDGTNRCEIKRLTKDGFECYLKSHGSENVEEFFGKLMARYSRLPWFAKRVYG